MGEANFYYFICLKYNCFCPCDIEHSFKMPAENLEEEGLPKNPDLELAQLKFRLGQESHKNDGALKQKLMESVEKDSMAKFYEDTCNELGWPIDQVELQKMKDANKAKLTELKVVRGAFRLTYEKSVSLGMKLDLIFHQIRIGL